MAKRLALLVLIGTVAFAGLASCPRGVLACSISARAARGCCGEQITLEARNCCTRGLQVGSPVLGTTGAERANGPATKHLTVATLLPLSLYHFPDPVTPAASSHRALAPPHTLLSQHTALLL